MDEQIQRFIFETNKDEVDKRLSAAILDIGKSTKLCGLVFSAVTCKDVGGMIDQLTDVLAIVYCLGQDSQKCSQ